MTRRDRIIYALVMGVVIFGLGEFVFGAGTLLINAVFGVAMGVFSYFAVGLATGRSDRTKK